MNKLSTWLGSAALVCGFGLLASPASAAPLGNVGGVQSSPETSNVEPVRYRGGCYRHRGHLHCPSHRRYSYYDDYPYYGSGYGYGYGPSIGFSFGGGGRHWGGGGHHHGGRGHR